MIVTSAVSTRNQHKLSYWQRKKFNPPDHPVSEAFVLPKLAYIRKIIGIQPNYQLLDVGAGPGTFTYYFSRFIRTTAIDNSLEMVARSPCRDLITLGNAEKMPFSDDSFDIVFSSNLLHHADNPGRVLSEMRRVSKEFVVLVEPNRSNIPMFMFLLLVKEERKGLAFSRRFLMDLVRDCHLNTICCFSTGLIFQNMTPVFLIPLLKIFDAKIPFGAYTILIAKKERQVKDEKK